MRNYLRRGERLSLPAPSGGVVSGQGVLIGALFGIAGETAAEGELFTLVTEAEVEIAKTSALAISTGDLLYWNNTNKTVNKTATGNKFVGIATSDAANPSPTVAMKLVPNGMAIAS